jgi:hypothetical protein
VEAVTKAKAALLGLGAVVALAVIAFAPLMFLFAFLLLIGLAGTLIFVAVQIKGIWR